MKNILEYYLDTLDIKYTRHFADALYQEHPHKNNMYGLKRMLDVYGVKSQGIYIEKKDLQDLNYPCILHTNGNFVIGMDYDNGRIKYSNNGKEETVSSDKFKEMWTGHALVVEESTEATEPDYQAHLRDELISMITSFSIPLMLLFACAVGLMTNHLAIGWLGCLRVALSLGGVAVCTLLMEKQVYGNSRYGDRVCNLFHHADCNSVLDGSKAKVLGFSWSEIGMGYFIANILLLSLYPSSSGLVAVANWIAMLYGVWSIYYQWCVAKSWCVMCVIAQALIWTMGAASLASCFMVPFSFSIVNSLLSCIVFAVCIVSVHKFAEAKVIEEERTRALQQYRAIKADGDVAKALIGKSDYYETSIDDSSIIFGNPKAKMRVTIMSNPHCNPCARMHKQLEQLLALNDKDICVQYIFSSFNKELEDSSRYLISCFLDNNIDEALHKFDSWYSHDKYDYKNVVKKSREYMHSGRVETEMEKHRKWREKTALHETPTVLVNGYKLPKEYKLMDLAMIVTDTNKKKNISQDINSRSTTLLGADQLSAEEAV